MAVSKAHIKATNKWMAKAYDRVNLTLPKGQKEVVQAHATAHGESVNGFIGRAISETMERDSGGDGVTKRSPIQSGAAAPGAVQEGAATAPAGRVVYRVPAGTPSESTQEAAETTQGGGVSLPSDTMKAAERAAKRTGETVAAFVARAVADQEKRDDRSFSMGINPS